MTLFINAPADLREALDQIKGKIGLIRHIASFRPGDILNTLASAKSAMRALARRWLLLHDEILAKIKVSGVNTYLEGRNLNHTWPPDQKNNEAAKANSIILFIFSHKLKAQIGNTV